ncbi:interferon-induced very large GTPase 1-like [Osmerus mordax]|uniref:interferon-induced very large GTPase 1-like n=2 Tax=Osmerus mordax TaxID=8014 RepID=UPI00350FDD53
MITSQTMKADNETMESSKQRREEVRKALTDLQKLSIEGRNRSDERVRGLEEKVRVALDVPKESWMPATQTLKDVMENIDRQVTVLQNTLPSTEAISNVDVLKSSSGGLALEGVYDTGELESLLKTRQQLIEPPESFSLFGSKQPVMYEQKDFSSRRTQNTFQKVIEKVGFSFGVNLSVGFAGFSLETLVERETSKETEKINKHSSEQSYIYNAKYNYVPLASCFFEKDQLKLSHAALAELEEIEKLILYSKNQNPVKNRIPAFFERYGSHVNQGPIHFGGVYWWTASAEGFQDSQQSEMKSLMSEALDIYVGAGYSGLFNVSAGVKTSSSQLKGSFTGKHNEALMSLVQLSVGKSGGPAEIDDHLLWKTHLVNNNKTWRVIDRGTNLMAVWDIIMSAHKHDFKDALKLSTTLMEAYAENTKQKVMPFWGEEVLSAEQSARNMIQSVEDWSVADGEKHLSELLQFKTSLREKTGSHRIWIQVCLSSQALQDYLLNVAKINSDPGAVNLRILTRSLMEPGLHSVNKFPDRTDIINWAYATEVDRYEVVSVSGFPELATNLQLARKKLEDATGALDALEDRNAMVEATRTITLSLNALFKTFRESGQEEAELLILTIIMPLGYCKDSKIFNHLLSLDEVIFLQDKLQKAYHRYSSLKELSLEKAQAFLFVTALTASSDEDLNVTDKRKKLQIIKSQMKDRISTSIKSAIEGTNHDWKRLEERLNSIIDESKLIDRGVKPEEVIKDLVPKPDGSSCEVHEDEKMEPRCAVEDEKTTRCMNLLHKLGLSNMLPKRMQQRDVQVIDALSQDVKPPKTETELSSQYLYKLMMLDYRARFLSCKPEPTTTAPESHVVGTEDDDDDFLNFSEETVQKVHIEEQHIHPMDIHMAVFHCADDFLRQYIFSKLSSCQFALPLLVSNPFTREIEFPLWALRNIKKSWQSKAQSKMDSHSKYKSRHMFNTPVPVASFIRLGESSISKSEILNNVISKQKHKVFFHRNCKGSTRDCLLMDGVVEITWYCPAGKEDDIFDDCVAFLNLHGDARDHPQQLEFMQSVSTVNVVLLSECPLDEKNKKIFKNLYTSTVPLIVLFAGQEKSLTFKNPTKVKLGAKNRNEAELNEEIISHIQHCVNTYKKNTSIKIFCDEARKHQFKVDEDKKSCRDGHEQANVLMCLLREERSLNFKEKLLPLQGKLWHDWCRKDKDQYRLKCKGKESLECQLDAIKNEKASIRKAQLEAASPPNEFMRSFITCLTSPAHSQETKSYMLQWLRIFLDEFNLGALAGYEEEYLSTWATFKCGPKVEGGSTNTDPLLTKLNTISDKMTATTIGLQHIMRETSQIYEVFKPTTKHQKETYEFIEALPAIGAEMLMSGLPLELMDGDAAHVPLLWIQAVFDRLNKTLGDKKVFVLSVIGLQSSGKSTLLNAMFGLQFTVSAGRCTRGAFMQLIKVDPAIVAQQKYEYVLVVDTEGLRSPELSTNMSLSHDNELATFIIGIGDITIINIMGENPSEMHDILQICVQAFLRMKQVKITPSCIFVHQNVAEASAGEKNMEGRINLMGKLDAMAVTAAKEEQIDNVTGFSDIIQFDVKTQVFYFKGLLEGDPPMAPPNPSYSRNVQELKNKVLSTAQWKSGCRFSTLSEVKVRIRDLWNGLLKENFVFSFRNTLEIMVYSDLENMFSEWSWKLRKHALDKENELYNQLLSNIIEDVSQKDLIVDFGQVYDPLTGEIDTYFKGNKHPEILIQWKVTIDKRLENLNRELIQNILKKCKDVITIKKNKSELDQRNSDYEEELLKMSKNLAFKLKDQRLTDQDVERQFNSIWTDWNTKVANEKPPEKCVNVRAVVEGILHVQFQNQNDITGKIRNKKAQFNLDVKKHVNKSWWNSLDRFNLFHGNPEDCMNQCTHQVTNRVKRYITGKEAVGNDFNDSFIHEILSNIKSEINDYEKSNKVEFTKEYQTDLSVHLCIKAIPTFERMHSSFRKTVDPITYLKSKREQYLQMCTNFCKGANSITIFADFLCKQLEPAIKQQINLKTSLQICDSLMCNNPAFNGNRSNLENHILVHLAKKRSFDDYEDYINKAKTYFERFIQGEVETSCSNDNMTDMHIENLHSLESVMLKVNTDVTAQVVSQRGNAKTWLDIFCKKLGTHMVIKREDLTSIENERIRGLTELKEMMAKCINEMVMKMVKQEKQNSGKEYFATLKNQASKHLFDHHQGCWAQCPFCKAICTNTIPGHDGDHSVMFHRSKAIAGRHWKDTDNFSIDFCSTSVSSDDKFSYHGGYMPYKTYRDAGEPYSQWSITADGSNQCYWKWFLCAFQSQWENKNRLKFAGLGEIPQSWRQITPESALKELK